MASEVKSLASQTPRVTEEISAQVADMQEATAEAVKAIENIGGTIGGINDITVAIASAVKEKGWATHEIARDVQVAASGTNEVSNSIDVVTSAAGETGTAAGQVLTSAEELKNQTAMLRQKVNGFLANIRAS